MHKPPILTAIAFAAASLSACGGGGGDNGLVNLPQLTAAVPANLSANCTDLAQFAFPNTTIASATLVAAGTVNNIPAPEHCLVKGSMFNRTSAVDGQDYAIGFEMRLPRAWNGRFYYQANGGTDGNVVPATGIVGGGGPVTSALNMGFAVISSDAGHASPTSSLFGIDPQARLDYGYQAEAKLTPMAKALIKAGYGKGPDRSYFGGCSNGGRHTMVAASRLATEYDGFLVGDPGFRLPLAAIANIKSYQTLLSMASTPGDASTGFTAAERATVSNAVLARCDALDGATDGLVQDGVACQAAFDLNRDVPTCAGARDGTCLTADQKAKIAGLFAGVTNGSGERFYSSWPYDAGFATTNWGNTWKFGAPPTRDAPAVGFIWEVPPEDPASFNGANFAATGNVDAMLAKVNATNATYTESAMSFMTPPNPTNLSALKNRGAKMMVYHGTSDPIFSSDDTKRWYNELAQANGGSAATFARYYPVPGMNHCGAGPSTDQFDMLTPLVNWVEKGAAPEAVIAQARGTGNAVPNGDVPSTWAPNRTRPLCPYPQVARYKGSGSLESADSFACK